MLAGGLASSGVTDSGYRVSASLYGGVESSGVVAAQWFTDALPQGGIASEVTYSSTLLTECLLQGEAFSSSFLFTAELVASTRLRDGLESTSAVGGDAVSLPYDVLYNTWALSLVSVTPLLEIRTPLGDT
jgi:hypothetical protein